MSCGWLSIVATVSGAAAGDYLCVAGSLICNDLALQAQRSHFAVVRAVPPPDYLVAISTQLSQ